MLTCADKPWLRNFSTPKKRHGSQEPRLLHVGLDHARHRLARLCGARSVGSRRTSGSSGGPGHRVRRLPTPGVYLAVTMIHPDTPTVALGADGKIVCAWTFDTPRFEEIRESVKRIGFRFDAASKTWRKLPTLRDAGLLVDLIAEHGFHVDAAAAQLLDEMTRKAAENIEHSRAAEADLTIPLPSPDLVPFPFQVAGVRYVIENDG